MRTFFLALFFTVLATVANGQSPPVTQCRNQQPPQSCTFVVADTQQECAVQCIDEMISCEVNQCAQGDTACTDKCHTDMEKCVHECPVF